MIYIFSPSPAGGQPTAEAVMHYIWGLVVSVLDIKFIYFYIVDRFLTLL